VDLLIETAGGQLIGIEVKASATVTASNARHLAWLNAPPATGKHHTGRRGRQHAPTQPGRLVAPGGGAPGQRGRAEYL
jgi:hypothetical protein